MCDTELLQMFKTRKQPEASNERIVNIHVMKRDAETDCRRIRKTLMNMMNKVK